VTTRVLFWTIPAAGHVTGLCVIAAELVARGHEVAVLTTDDHVSAVRRAGAEPVAYPTTWDRATAPDATTDGEEPTGEVPAGEVAAWAPLVMLSEAAAQVPAARAHLAGRGADVLVYDTTTRVAARAVAHAHGLPAVELFCSFASTPGFRLDEHLSPPEDHAGSLVDPDHPALARWRADAAALLTAHDHPVTDPAGLARVPEQSSLVLTSPRLQPRAEAFDASFAFVGTVRPPIRRGTADGPVLVSWGTEPPSADAGFLAGCAQAFARARLPAVLATGATPVASLGPLPAGVTAAGHVDQPAVLDTARAMVGHGGMGGVMEALARGVPLILTPRTPEQALVADRVAALGLGVRLSWRDTTPCHLVTAVRLLLADSATRNRVSAFAAHLAGCGGAARATDVILHASARH